MSTPKTKQTEDKIHKDNNGLRYILIDRQKYFLVRDLEQNYGRKFLQFLEEAPKVRRIKIDNNSQNRRIVHATAFRTTCKNFNIKPKTVKLTVELV